MKTFSKKPGSSEQTSRIACPVCGETGFSSCWTVEKSRWVRCRTCSLLLQNPQPLSRDIIERYDEEYFRYEQENEEAFLNLMKLGLRDIGFDKLDIHNREERSFLDIGCATGRLSAAMRDSGWDARGVEVCRPAAEFGIRELKVPIHIGTIEDAAFDDNSFDVVHNSHVIEHINQPDVFVKEIHRILKPGGYFICTTPNALGFQALFFKERWRSVIADHLFLFSTRTLPLLAEKSGFRVIRKKTWGGLGKGTAPDWLKKTADRVVKPLGWGDVMILLFQKS